MFNISPLNGGNWEQEICSLRRFSLVVGAPHCYDPMVNFILYKKCIEMNVL
jgi:hypothetical protein